MTRSKRLGTCLVAILLSSPWGAPASAGAPAGFWSKIDTRLAERWRRGEDEVTPVWITFTDKGERDALDLAARLTEAEAALTPRARARRERARLKPLVDYRDLPVDLGYLSALRGLGHHVYGVSRWFNHAAVRLAPQDYQAIVQLPFVRRIAPAERAMRSRPETLEPRLPAVDGGLAARPMSGAIDYGMALNQVAQIGVPAVHDSGYTGAGVLICVLDEGFNGHETHEALTGLIVPPGHRRDFVDGDTTVTNPGGNLGFSHGTWVLGCMAGDLPGTYVGSGFGATYALARTENAFSETPVEMVNWLMGAEWADSLGADIINSSVGYFTFDNPDDDYTVDDMDGQTTVVSRAAQIAASKGILVVTSAGNTGNNPLWPGGRIVAPADVHGDSLIAVGAVDAQGVRTSFSAKGPTADGRIKPDLMARGGSASLVAASDPQTYFTGSGTSFSAPLVAGLAACVMEARPGWTPTMVIRALRETASQALFPDNLYGYGIPNGLSALQWPRSAPSEPPPFGAPRITLAGPNPLRSDGAPARVRFALHQDATGPAEGRVQVFDGLGRIVQILWVGTLVQGEWQTVSWDGRGDGGETLRSGLYFISLEVNDEQRSVRVSLLR